MLDTRAYRADGQIAPTAERMKAFARTEGYDFIADPSNAIDGDGIDADPDDSGDQSRGGGTSSFHGTHVAGTVGAFTDDEVAVPSADETAAPADRR